MVGAGSEVLTYAAGDVVRSPQTTPGSTSRSLPPPARSSSRSRVRRQVVGVVRQGEKARGEGSRRPPGRAGVLFQHHTDLGGQQRIGPEEFAGPGRVFDRYEVGVGTRGPAAAASASIRGPRAARSLRSPGYRRSSRVEGIEVVVHLTVWADVSLDDRCVTGSETEDETVRIPELEVRDGLSDLVGGRRPDAHDAAAHHHPSGRFEQPLEMRREPWLEPTRRPQCRVAEFFQLGGDVE